MNLIVTGKPNPSLRTVVITREGKRYDLGTEKRDGDRWYHKLERKLRLNYYKWHRAKNLNPKDRAEFIEEIKRSKV